MNWSIRVECERQGEGIGRALLEAGELKCGRGTDILALRLQAEHADTS